MIREAVAGILDALGRGGDAGTLRYAEALDGGAPAERDQLVIDLENAAEENDRLNRDMVAAERIMGGCRRCEPKWRKHVDSA